MSTLLPLDAVWVINFYWLIYSSRNRLKTTNEVRYPTIIYDKLFRVSRSEENNFITFYWLLFIPSTFTDFVKLLKSEECQYIMTGYKGRTQVLKSTHRMWAIMAYVQWISSTYIAWVIRGSNIVFFTDTAVEELWIRHDVVTSSIIGRVIIEQSCRVLLATIKHVTLFWRCWNYRKS